MRNLLLIFTLTLLVSCTKKKTSSPSTCGGSGIITTIAGNGTAGYSGDGGAATAAELNYPSGVAVDGSGNVYIADWYNNRVRKVTPSGIISTIAGGGNGSGGLGDGGPATAAIFFRPYSIAIDGSDNLYIADQNNYRIRLVTPSGMISTIAGNGTQGYSGDGGAATSAEIGLIYGIAVDGSGSLYFGDRVNNYIRKVTSSGTISTIAGNGTAGYSGDGGAATSAEINTPIGLTADGGGNIYFADAGNNRIRKVTPTGTIATIAGNGTAGYSGDCGAAISAELNAPCGVAIDGSGNIYVGDQLNNRIRKVTSSGSISTVAGTGAAGYSGDEDPATAAELYRPDGITIDGSGNLYITDILNNRVRKVSF